MHVQLSNCLTLTWDATSRNGQRQARWPKCAATRPPGKLAAQLKSRFGDSCLKLIWTFLETPGGVIQLQSDLLHTPIWAFSCRNSHFVVPKHWNGDHVGVPKQPCGNWTLFLRASKEGTRPGLYLMIFLLSLTQINRLRPCRLRIRSSPTLRKSNYLELK